MNLISLRAYWSDGFRFLSAWSLHLSDRALSLQSLLCSFLSPSLSDSIIESQALSAGVPGPGPPRLWVSTPIFSLLLTFEFHLLAVMFNCYLFHGETSRIKIYWYWYIISKVGSAYFAYFRHGLQILHLMHIFLHIFHNRYTLHICHIYLHICHISCILFCIFYCIFYAHILTYYLHILLHIKNMASRVSEKMN